MAPCTTSMAGGGDERPSAALMLDRPWLVRHIGLKIEQTFVFQNKDKGKAMGVEGRERQRELESGAQVLSGQLGKTIQRLRKAYNLSLSELAEQSGVAKSIISQIERNETNPTLATIWRLSQALDISIDRVLATADDEPFIEKTSRADTPILVSEDSKLRLAIIGWIKTVEWLQWYHVTSEPGGVLESEPHQRGSVECLSVLEGEFEVEIGGVVQRARAGETLRYRCDRPHSVRCTGEAPGHAVMVCILKAAVMD
jgi:transcriptional regulator with XRE-family HTH domain